jgi:hypothetical protein
MGHATAMQTPMISPVERRMGPMPPSRPKFSGEAKRKLHESDVHPCHRRSESIPKNPKAISPAELQMMTVLE